MTTDTRMETHSVNPWTWQDAFGYSQAIHLRHATEVLALAGQGAMSPDGEPMHPGDMAGQLALTLDNIETVLGQAGFSLGDVVRLGVYTTDVDLLLANWGPVAARLATAGTRPGSTLLGVTRLAYPELLVEIEATAYR